MDESSESSRPALAGLGIESTGAEELSRGDVLLKGVLGAAALYGLGAVTPYVREALGAGKRSDADVLNYLLPFEYLQASLYERGKSGLNEIGGKLRMTKEDKELVETLLGEEDEHVAAVREMIEGLGGEPFKEGSYAFGMRQFESFLSVAGTLERIAVLAYNGAIPSLKSAEAKELALSIVQVEGRHAARVLLQGGEDPSPEPFDVGINEDYAINLALPFTGLFPGEWGQEDNEGE
jgi:rubrerythrin